MEILSKVDLHCHSITSAPIDFFKKINPNFKLPSKNFHNFNNFDQYLKTNINPLIKNIDICRQLIKETFEKFIADGVIYIEMSFDLTLPEYIGVTIEDFFGMIDVERKIVADKIRICIDAGIDRELNSQKTLVLFKRALKTGLLGGVDLYGYENGQKIDNFIELYKIAGQNGLKLKAHIGETGSPTSIKEAIQKLNLKAIQHGVRAIENESVVDYLIKKQVVLNICPTSNLALRLYKDIENHPIKQLFDKGVIITVGSDDFSIFGMSATDELINLYKNNIFNKQEIEEIIDNGLKQIW